MGNDLHKTPNPKNDEHLQDEELPLNSTHSELTPDILPTTGDLPAGWEQRIDYTLRKPYYVDHNTSSTQWNPPNTITKVDDKWIEKNDANDAAKVVIHLTPTHVSPLSDCWDIEDPNADELLQFDDTLYDTISLRKPTKHWVSCFGTKIVNRGDYKRWKIKILPQNSDTNHTKKRRNKSIAKVVIGVVDIECLTAEERGKSLQREFWNVPFFGYGVNGENGKKYHIAKNGTSYSNKYKIGDEITVELNRTENRFITHNDLRFYTNDKVNGMAFDVEDDRSYVLAVALCSDKYRIQISS